MPRGVGAAQPTAGAEVLRGRSRCELALSEPDDASPRAASGHRGLSRDTGALRKRGSSRRRSTGTDGVATLGSWVVLREMVAPEARLRREAGRQRRAARRSCSDDSSQRERGHSSDGRGSWASAVSFPTRCWRLTGRVADISLTYVVRVIRRPRGHLHPPPCGPIAAKRSGERRLPRAIGETVAPPWRARRGGRAHAPRSHVPAESNDWRTRPRCRPRCFAVEWRSSASSGTCRSRSKQVWAHYVEGIAPFFRPAPSSSPSTTGIATTSRTRFPSFNPDGYPAVIFVPIWSRRRSAAAARGGVEGDRVPKRDRRWDERGPSRPVDSCRVTGIGHRPVSEPRRPTLPERSRFEAPARGLGRSVDARLRQGLPLGLSPRAREPRAAGRVHSGSRRSPVRTARRATGTATPLQRRGISASDVRARTRRCLRSHLREGHGSRDVRAAVPTGSRHGQQ